VEGDGEKAPGRGIGLDVEGEDRQPRRPVRGRDLGVLEDQAKPRSFPSRAADLEGAADAPVDQVPHGEADVGLVGPNARLLQAVAQRGSVRRLRHLDAHDGPSEQGHAVGGHLPSCSELPRARRVGLLDVEVRDEPAVPHEERAPALEPSEEVHDGATRLDAVRRLQDEPAERGHGRPRQSAANPETSLAPRVFPTSVQSAASGGRADAKPCDRDPRRARRPPARGSSGSGGGSRGPGGWVDSSWPTRATARSRSGGASSASSAERHRGLAAPRQEAPEPGSAAGGTRCGSTSCPPQSSAPRHQCPVSQRAPHPFSRAETKTRQPPEAQIDLCSEEHQRVEQDGDSRQLRVDPQAVAV
jgi:hypothetical protein